MTHRVVVTAAAERDLGNIHRWIARESGIDVATMFVDRLAARIQSLADFPNRGPVPPEFASYDGQVRQALVPPYRLFYDVEEEIVTVFAVAHSRRELAELLQRRRLHRG